jgi:hypothetical protein
MEERDRIVGIIQGRIDIHSNFVNFYMSQEVDPPVGILGALSELSDLLRKIECRD